MNRNVRHLDFLDLLRGVAILAVFCFHGLEPSFGFEHLHWVHGVRRLEATRTFLAVLPCCLGWAGVPIFFAVSGFCIHLSYTRQATSSWRDFFVRRFFRIYPPYLAALLFFVCVWQRTPGAVLPPADLATLWSHVFLLHNLDGNTFFGIDPAYWSIAVEAQLYLLYPLWLFLTRRLGWAAALSGVAVLELGLRLAFSDIYSIYDDWNRLTWLITSPLNFWFSWALGAAAAEFFLNGRFQKLFRTPPLLWLSLAAAVYFFQPVAPLSFPLFSLATCTAIARFLDGRWSLSAIPRRVATHLQSVGVWSYSIYLLHQPLQMAVPFLARRWLPHGASIPPIVLFALSLSSWALIVPLGAYFYRFVEQPAIGWGKRCLQTFGKSVGAPA